jgi:hypothetical protein
MVRVYDRICLIYYKTNEPRSKTCVYCDNELPYREVSREVSAVKELEKKYG